MRMFHVITKFPPSIRRIISHFMFPFLFRPVLCGSSGTSGKDGPPPHGRYIPSIERRGRQNNFSDMSLLGGFASRRSHWKIRKHKRWKLLPKCFTSKYLYNGTSLLWDKDTQRAKINKIWDLKKPGRAKEEIGDLGRLRKGARGR